MESSFHILQYRDGSEVLRHGIEHNADELCCPLRNPNRNDDGTYPHRRFRNVATMDQYDRLSGRTITVTVWAELP